MKILYVVLAILLTTQVAVAKNVKCIATLAEGLTKDGYAKITLVCDGPYQINTGSEHVMYVNQEKIIFKVPKKD